MIDITEMPEVYRNATARLVYLHLALRAGYHDNDRDQVTVSIRRLAMEAGVTVSAVRHALHQLERAGLLSKDPGRMIVKKWVEEQTITTRAKTKREMQEQIQILERQRIQAVHELESQERRQYDPEKATDNDAFRRLKAKFGTKPNKK